MYVTIFISCCFSHHVHFIAYSTSILGLYAMMWLDI